MNNGKPIKQRVRILVKAYPQPSAKYGETVCCAGITEDGSQFLRLYPIMYRQLPPESKFGRYDLVEMETLPATNDSRPETRRVVPDTIRKIPTRGLSDSEKVRLWAPFVAPSLMSLREENERLGKSLGIIRPDPGSLEFLVEKVAEISMEDRELTRTTMLSQQGLFDEVPLTPLEQPELAFSYRFTSGGQRHKMVIHDWEVQTAWFNFKRRYKTKSLALEMLQKEYGREIPKRHPHFLMGTVGSRPKQFIMIGILRSGVSPEDATRQGELIF